MAINNNPASRLFEIIEHAYTFDDNRHMREVWSTILLCEGTQDTSKILRGLSQIIGLLAECKKQLVQIDDLDYALYSEPLDQLAEVFLQVNLDENLGSFKRRLSAGTTTGLKFCADALAKSSLEDVVEEEFLTGLLAEVNELLEEVIRSDLPDQVKKLLLDSLEDIRAAIIDYRVMGVQALQNSLKHNVGSVLLARAEIENVSEKVDKEILSRFGRLLSKLEQVVYLGSRVKQLAEPVIKLLSLPSGDQ